MVYSKIVAEKANYDDLFTHPLIISNNCSSLNLCFVFTIQNFYTPNLKNCMIDNPLMEYLSSFGALSYLETIYKNILTIFSCIRREPLV